MRFTNFAVRAHWRTGLAVTALVLPGLIMAGATAAAASPAGAAATGSAAATGAAARQTGKPVPARPPSTPGAGLGAAVPAKPGGLPRAVPLTSWSVSLTVSPNVLWPTQYSTLTATANSDVGPTPYYLRIYDVTAGAYVVTCATGTTCSAPVTQPVPAAHYYVAVVSYSSAGYPPAGEQAVSSEIGVVWHGVSLTLAASQPTVPVGASSTLTAATSQDIGPSPFWIEIFDVTTGTRAAVCGYGTSCSATVSQAAAATHEYVAYLSANSAAYPPPSIQETSLLSLITWSNLGWRVSLSAPAGTYGSETVTASTNANVGPTPYYIEIFNETGALLAVCGSGTSCSATFTPSYAGSNLVAFVTSYSTAFPPAGIVASSNVATTYLRIIP
jgi:hypothetical protein